MNIRERLRGHYRHLEARLEPYTHHNAWHIFSLIHPIPKPDGHPSYTPDQQAFYKRAIPAIDRQLLERPGLLTLTVSEEEVTAQLGTIVKYTADTLRSNPNSIVISPLYGTTPSLTSLRNEMRHRFNHHSGFKRIHPIVVSRSIGTQLVETQIFGAPDLSAFRDPSIRKIILEDIVDKAGVIDTLIKRISGMKPNNAIERAKLMEQYNIVLAVLFSKNEACIDALKTVSGIQTTPWQKDQYALLQYVIERPADDWMMGWGPDTGFEGQTIISHKNMADYRQLSKHDPFLHNLLSPLTWSELRIGSTLPGGYKLNATYSDFLDIVSLLLTVELTREEYFNSERIANTVYTRPKG